jgi:hypothetical protein
MTEEQKLPFRERVLSEIWDEMSSLEGHELDLFLREVGLDPDELLHHYEQSVDGTAMALKRSRFEEARQHIRNKHRSTSSKVVSLTVVQKRQIFAAIKGRTAETKDMTMAARNQRIDAEQDLDSFLEACIKLGVIDEDGNLIV